MFVSFWSERPHRPILNTCIFIGCIVFTSSDCWKLHKANAVTLLWDFTITTYRDIVRFVRFHRGQVTNVQTFDKTTDNLSVYSTLFFELLMKLTNRLVESSENSWMIRTLNICLNLWLLDRVFNSKRLPLGEEITLP